MYTTLYDNATSKRILQLHSAILNNQISEATALLASISDAKELSSQIKNSRDTLLHAAARIGSVVLVKKLLELGVDVNLREKLYQQTALHISALNGHTACMVVLLRRGADINAQDIWGQSPLFTAVYGKHVNAVSTLINYNGIDINLQEDEDEGHETALDMARRKFLTKISDMLVKAGARTKDDIITPSIRKSFLQ